VNSTENKGSLFEKLPLVRLSNYFGFAPRDEELPLEPPSAPAECIGPREADGAGLGVNTGRDVGGDTGAGDGARFTGAAAGGGTAGPEFLMPADPRLKSRSRLRITESSSRSTPLVGGAGVGLVAPGFGLVTGAAGTP